MKTGVKVALGAVGVAVLGCGGFGGSVAWSFPASQGTRIDGGDFVGVETGGAYAWVIPSESGVVLIDAGMDRSAAALKAEIGGRPVQAVFVTHGHVDHVSGLSGLGEVDVFVGPGESSIARGEEGPGALMPTLFGSMMGFPEPPPDVMELQGDETLRVDGLDVRCIHVPGHTRGSMAYVVGDTVFTGDAALGHPDHIAPVHTAFTADMPAAKQSLSKLMGVASRLADGHAGLHSDLPSKLENTLK